MKKVLLGMMILTVLAWHDCSVQAQDASSNINVSGIDLNLKANPFTVYRDYIGDRSSFFWTRQPSDVAINPDQEPDSRLEIQVLQKPRVILWVQPVQQVGGFKLFFQF